VLHTIAGLPLLGHVVAAMRGAGVERIVVVTSPSGDRYPLATINAFHGATSEIVTVSERNPAFVKK
jgi:bifunctional N-acetylglucosamine-1-phosphate-uridyltransferase/glucosamine-1-phosphate-acetyltransferase GlmU-like protein